MECDNNLMKHAIETPVEMPAVAGRTLKYFIRKGERAKWSARRTGVLAACVGLILFGSIDSLKADDVGVGEGIVEGAIEDGGFGKELFTFIGIQLVEATVNGGLNQLNNAAPGSGAGTLMSALGGNTTDAQLANISSQIAVAQGMIASLQANLDNFENQTSSMLQGIANKIDWQNYGDARKQVDAD